METSIMEEREELMVSPLGNPDPTLKLAHFLKPSFTSSIHELQPPPFHLLQPPNPKTKNSLNISFSGSINPLNNWKNWVTHMQSLHQTIWKEVGIHDAILNSTYKININRDLVLSFADKWSCQTNSFAFPWGEVTITLEDMIFLGGYSVLGDSVFHHPENTEEIEALEELEKVRKEFNNSRARKASHVPWMSRFMNSEARVEHGAFLALWLSRFVFPQANNTVSKNVLPIAVRLAQGTKVALAPTVLASIYRDLRLMKETLNESREYEASSVVVWSPMQLVQIWICDRFPKMNFKPNDIENGEPPFSRWCESDTNKEMNYIRAVRELGSEDFRWCSYGMWPCKFYNVKEGWVLMDKGLDEELDSFARCLRVSELVGIDSSCIEQYLPHRVAMQYGLGQDIPGPVARANGNAETAWEDFLRPIGDVGLYFPSRFFEPCVTSRYLNWWNCLSEEDTIMERITDKFPLVPPGFSPRGPIVEVSSSSDEGNIVQSELESEECKKDVGDVNMPQTAEVIGPYSFPRTCYGVDELVQQISESSKANKRSILPDPKGKKSNNLPRVPPVFSPMCPMVEVSSSSNPSNEGQQVIAKKSLLSHPMQTPSSTMTDHEAFGKGNIVQSEERKEAMADHEAFGKGNTVQSEEWKDVDEDVNMPKTTAEVIVPPSFPQTCTGSDELLSSKANTRASEMGNIDDTKESKNISESEDMSEAEKEVVNQNIVHLERENGESSSLHESEILGSRYEGRISNLEKIFAYLKAAKQNHRLD